MTTPWRSQLRSVRLLFGLALVSTSCKRGPAPSEAPGFDTSYVDTASVATLAAQGARLDYDTLLGAADAQPLLVKGGLRYGFAKIEPVRQPQPLDTAALARGRILARISSESAYAALGLGPGMNWWWIDHKGGTWRSIVYSEARNERSIKILDSLRPHPGYPWRQSIARFVFLDTVVAMWHYSGGHCVPTSNLPAWYALLEKAAPWRTPGPPRRP